jgi:hypothetical protein
MNKDILNEIIRVREVMGLKSQNIISEQTSPRLIVMFLKSLAKRSTKLASIVNNKGVVKLFDDDILWKKYADGFDGVTNNDEFLDALTTFSDYPVVKEVVKDLLMTNSETREVILKYLLPKDGVSPDIYVSGIKRKNSIDALNKLGISIDETDLVKVIDDVYYPGGRGNFDMLTKELNPIAKAIKNASKLPKNIFFKGGLKGMNTDKGEVLTNFIKKYAKTPEEVADVMVDAFGMTRREANKIRLVLDGGEVIDDLDLVKRLFNSLATHPNQSIKEEFVKEIIGNKNILNKIQTGGKDGLMTKEEMLALFGGDSSFDDIVDILADNITKKTVSAVTKTGKFLKGSGNIGWKTLKAPITFFKWAFASGINFPTRIYRLFVYFTVMPTFFATDILEGYDWGRAILDIFRGNQPKGTLIDCLRPDSELQGACNSKSYISVFLTNNPECDNQALEGCSGESSELYFEAAKNIAIELGTYREIAEDVEIPADIDTDREDWETGTNQTGWFTGDIPSIEKWWGTWFWSNRKTDEGRIKKILNKRGSLFGIAKIATEYYENTTRNLWDDMVLMETQGRVASGYYKKLLGWSDLDITRDVLLDIQKEFYTWGDGNVAVANLSGVKSKLKWEFPKSLYGRNTGSSIWKPCFGGTLPVNLQVRLEACGDGSCNSDGIAITKESDLGKLSAEDFNDMWRKWMDNDWDLYNLPMKDTPEGAKYSPKGSITYACAGKSRPTDWDEELDSIEKGMEALKTKLTTEIKEEIIGLERVLKS